MSTRRVEVAGPAPAELVWERYAEPARWPEWAPHLRSVEASCPRIEPGCTGVVRGPGPARSRFRVTCVDAACRTWSWRVTSGPVCLHLRHHVTATDAGCVAGLEITGSAPVVLAYLPVATWALHRLVHLPPGSPRGAS